MTSTLVDASADDVRAAGDPVRLWRRPGVGAMWRALVVVGLLLVAAHTAHPPTDLGVYRAGAVHIWNGGDALYTVTGPRGLPFTYTPFAGLLMTPLAWVPRAQGAALMHLATLVALARLAWLAAHALIDRGAIEAARTAPGGGAALLALRARADRWAPWLLVFLLLTEPVIKTLLYGQVNVLLAWMAAEAWLARGRRWWPGILLGLAMGIKLTPGIMLLALLVTRRWRAAAVMAGTGAVTGLVGLALLPRSTMDFLRVGGDASRVGPLHYASNQNLNGVLHRAFGPDGQPALYAAGVVLVLALGALAVRRADAAGADLAALLAASVAGLLVSPVSWSHHWVIAPLLAALLWVQAQGPQEGPVTLAAPGARARGWARGLALAWAVALVGWVIWWAPAGLDREYSQSAAQQLLTASYVWLGLASLAWVALSHRPALGAR